MAKTNGFTAEQFIKAIPGTGGVITAIARKVGCDWHTAKKYIDEFATVKRAYDDESEGILDLAEAKLIEAIHSGDTGMIRFYLTTKGKHRGYTEKHEIAASNLNIDISSLDDEQLQRIANGDDPLQVIATTKSES